jgi:hypothetical protein
MALAALSTSSCRGPSPDWNGTWKLNPSKSDIPGPTFTVAITQDGEYHTANGTTTGRFRCDGKEYPSEHQVEDVDTISCTQRSATEVDLIHRKNGAKTLTIQWELSPDGKMLTVISMTLSSDGSTRPKERWYTRSSGSTGFEGGWRSVNPLEREPSIWQINLDNRRFHYDFPERNQYADVPFEGTDTPVHGPGVPAGVSIALKERGPRDFSMTKKLNGQVLDVGYLQITPDGRSLTESYWSPEGPDEKAVLVYEKQ